MNWWIWSAACLSAAATAFFVWVRIAPHDPVRWHVMPNVVEAKDTTGGALRVVPAAPGGLATLDTLIRSTARTQALAGSVESGMVTYITRSKIVWFPDYTTIRANGANLEMYGRSRFGASDLGVNAARIDAWIADLGQGG